MKMRTIEEKCEEAVIIARTRIGTVNTSVTGRWIVGFRAAYCKKVERVFSGVW